MIKKNMPKSIVLICSLGLWAIVHGQRSVHRPHNPSMPTISTIWSDQSTPVYTLKSPYLEEWAIFGRFNKDFLMSHQLPASIPYRYDATQSVNRTTLDTLINEFITELLTVKRKYHNFKNFIILKDRDFNYKKSAGIIIIKFKNYPFVVKLFRETPKTFTRPFSKGIQPNFFFVMGGGINRYLAGFTRLPNLHALNKKIAADPYWSQRLTTPRKWFWVPENGHWFTVTGQNIGKTKDQTVLYPSIYCIICDAIEIEREFTIANKRDRKVAMKLARFVGNRIDPHIDNFIIEKNTGKIAFIDTEHFASMVGLREPLYFNHYASWYTRLGTKCLRDSTLRGKRTRKQLQKTPTPEILHV